MATALSRWIAFCKATGRLHGIAAEHCATSQEAWADLTHVLFNTKKFVLRE